MKHPDCVFCREDLKEFANGIRICELPNSRLFLFREQIYPGRCLLVTKSHAAEVYDLPDGEREGFLSELTAVSRVLQKLYQADKMNFLSLGDTVGHVHIHIVPKRKTDPDWGGMFRFMAKEGYLGDEEYRAEIGKILEALKEAGLPAKV